MPTITEIAKHCGKSVTTVSHVLRDGAPAKRYSEKTRNLVMNAAKELNYIPNFFASQIQKQNRRAIMIGFGDLNDPFATAIASAFEDAAAERGYYLFTTTLKEGRKQPFHQSALGESSIQAFAVVGYSSRLAMPDTMLSGYAQKGVHVLSIGRPVTDRWISQVGYDNDGGVDKALDYLAEQGARRIWIAGCTSDKPKPSNAASLRARYAFEHCQNMGEDFSAQIINKNDDESKSYVEILRERLANEPAPDSIFCSTDTHALIAMQALSSHGLRVGHDVAVVGYNDEPYARLTSPSLTTVRIPMTKLGRIGANILIDQYEGRESPGTRLTLDTELIIRESGQLTQ